MIYVSRDLRKSYGKISEYYLQKKKYPWRDFVKFIEEVNWDHESSIIDIGAGNGRNLNAIDSSIQVAFDLSFQLLSGFEGPPDAQKVAGSLPHLPFRETSFDKALFIAVLHHFRDSKLVIQSLIDTKRICPSGRFVISVWRKWRKQLKGKLIDRIRKGESIDDLVNHERPWYNSKRQVISRRFYHYYTFKELHKQLDQVGLKITRRKYLGGGHNDANIFVETSTKELL